MRHGMFIKFRMRRRDPYECDVPHPLSLDGKYHMLNKKVQIGNDQEMAQPERNSHSINRGVGKN